MFTQSATRILIQRFDIISDISTGHNAHRFNHAVAKALGKTGQGFVTLNVQKRLEQACDLAVDEVLQTALDLLRNIGTSFVVDKGHRTRFQRIVALFKLTHRLVAPHKATLFGEIDLGIRRVIEPVRPQMEMRLQRLNGRCLQRLGFLSSGILILTETEPFQFTDEFAFDGHFTLVIYFGQEGLLLFQSAQQNAGAPIYKSLSQTLV